MSRSPYNFDLLSFLRDRLSVLQPPNKKTAPSRAITPPTNGPTPPSNGGTLASNGGTPSANGETQSPNGGTPSPNGETQSPNGGAPSPNGETQSPNGGTPSPNGRIPPAGQRKGRDADGRFTFGNPGGPGNPFNRQIAAFRRAVCAALNEQDLHELAGVLLDRARGGDLAAIKILFQYSIGKPADAVDPDKLDLQELELYLSTATTPDALGNMFSRLPAATVCNVVRHALPVLGSEMAANLAHELQRDPKEREAERQRAEEEAEQDAEIDAWMGLA